MATTRQRRRATVPNELTKMLEGRRRELMHEVQNKIRDARNDGTKERDVIDQAEGPESTSRPISSFALIQMKSQTLIKIDAALRWLKDGTYGVCFECGGEIAERRLRALPFAVRCKDCEDTRETAERHERAMARRGSSSPFGEESLQTLEDAEYVLRPHPHARSNAVRVTDDPAGVTEHTRDRSWPQ